MKTTPDAPDPFEQKVKQVLDQQADDIDAITLARLKAARLRAVDTTASPSPHWLGSVITGTRQHHVGAVTASLAVAAIGTAFWWQSITLRAPAEPLLEDLALLERQEGLDFYEELDFYRWLDEQQKLG